MAKQLNVDLNFRANTSQAKQQIDQLQMSLSKIAVGTGLKVDSTSIKAASSAAKDLALHLNNAYNAQTGNFDLSKLDKSLRMSKQNISALSTELLKAGTTGQQAFVQLAQSIAAADRPMLAINSKLREFGTVLKNTARWQISSSILHGFIGTVQSAYGYAQDLNESLNNIRIVTGQNADQMSRFAETANRAAKSLSTTTNEYSKASLIYYQQGLSDAEVQKRTDVTIKMANVARQSAETVSDQMTSVWNNFYDGSKSLEYYADVMTALGAATASSTDEIAGGLEKFAAIADTIGLSYEYAASALATITSNTRQSEEVVGTALKTIFARIQGLNLGETLDDGTTLNKYSKALAAVGISIFDQNQQIKTMDNILNEMADKWQVISQDQQVALAQTVAGTRQYTQLVALMDNWNSKNANDSDSMVANLDTATNAEGALQQQQDIYEESWEAASNRVKASLESIYSDLLDDDFFIDLNNGFASLLDSLGAFIDGIGGVKTILMGIGSFVLMGISSKIQPALQSIVHNILVIGQTAKQQSSAIATEMNRAAQGVLNDESVTLTQSSKTALENSILLNEQKAKMQVVENKLSATEKQRYEQELAILQVYQDEVLAASQLVDKAQEAIQELSMTPIDEEAATKNIHKAMDPQFDALVARRQAAEAGEPVVESDTSLNLTQRIQEQTAQTEKLIGARSKYTQALYDSYVTEMQTTKGSIAQSEKQISLQDLLGDSVDEYARKLQNVISRGNDDTRHSRFAKIKQELDLIIGDSAPKLSQALSRAMDAKTPETLQKRIQEVIQELKNTNIPAADLERILRSMGQGKNVDELRKRFIELGFALDDVEGKAEQAKNAANGFNPQHLPTYTELISNVAAGFGQVAMAAQSFRSILQAWNNDDLTWGEKLTTILMSLSMIVPSLIGVWKTFKTVVNLETVAKIANTVATVANTAAEKANNAEKAKSTVTGKDNTDEVNIDTKQKLGTRIKNAWNQGALSKNKSFKKVDGGYTYTTKSGITTNPMSESMALDMAGTQAKNALTKLAGSFTLVAAGVAIVVGGISVAIKQFNTAAEAAENAQNQAKLLAESYSEAKTSYDTFNSTVDNYNSAVEEMEKLTRGTTEFNEALMEANDLAMELIDKYDLVGQYSIQNGLITFDKRALEEAQAKELDELGKVQSSKYIGAVTASYLTGQSNQTSINREIESSSDSEIKKKNAAAMAGIGVAGGTAIGTGIALGASIGSTFPVIGTIIGGILGGALGALGGVVATSIVGSESDDEDEALDKLTRYVEAYGNDIFAAKSSQDMYTKLAKTEFAIEDSELVKALYDNRKALNDFTQKEVKRMQEEESQWEQAFYSYNFSELSKLEVGAGYFTEQSNQYREENINSVRNEVDSMFDGSNDDFWAEYLKYVQGQTQIDEDNTQGESVRVRDLGGDYVTLEKLNEDGVWETIGEEEGLSEAVAAEQLAQAITLARASETIDIEILDKLIDDLQKAGFKLSEDSELMDDILSQFGDKNKKIDLSKWTPEDVLGIDLNSITDTELKNSLEEAQISYSKQMDKFEKEIYSSEWYKLLDNSERSLVWDINIDQYDTIEQVKEAVENAQLWLDNNNLIGSIDYGNEITGLLQKEQKTDSDWQTIKEKYDEMKQLNPFMLDWLDFMKLSQEEQIQYLNNYENYNRQILNSQVESGVIQAESNYNNAGKYVQTTKKQEDFAAAEVERAQHKENQYRDTHITPYYEAFKWEIPDSVEEFDFWGNEQISKTEQGSYDKEAFLDSLYDLQFLSPENKQQLNTIIEKVKDMPNVDGKTRSALFSDTKNLITEFTNGTVDPDKLLTLLMQEDDVFGQWLNAGEQEEFGKFLQAIQTNYNNYSNNTLSYVTETENAKNQLKNAKEEHSEATNNFAEAQKILVEALQVEQRSKDEMEAAISESGIDLKTAQDLGQILQDTNTHLKSNSTLASEIAKEMLRYEKAVKAVSSSYEDWIQILEGDSLIDQMSLMNELKTIYGDLLDIDGNELDVSFLSNVEYLNLMKEAIDGNIESYNLLQQIVSKDIYTKNIGEISEEIGKVITEISFIEGVDPGELILVDTLDENSLGYKLNQVYMNAYNEAIKGGKSVSEAIDIANSIIAAAGYQIPKVELEEYTVTTVGELPTGWQVASEGSGIIDSATNTEIPNISYKKIDGEKYEFTQTFLRPKNTISFTKSSEQVGGGTPEQASSKSNKTSKVKKSDTVERYKEITDRIDDVTDAADDASKAMDRLYGVGRIKEIEKLNKQLEQHKELLEEQRTEAERYLNGDRRALQVAAANAGVSFNIDEETGNITNYTEVMTHLNNLVNSQIGDGELSEEQEEIVNNTKERIADVEEAMKQYEETRELITDLDKEIQDEINEIQDNNYEILNSKLELEIELNEDDMQQIEYQLGKLEGEFSQLSEAAALMANGQLEIYQDNLTQYKIHLDSLNSAYENGDISQADYVDGLKNIKDGIYDNLNSLNDLDESMKNYYGETLAAAGEELAKFTSLMENHVSVLDHYSTLLDLLGRSKDFESIKTVLQTQVDLAENSAAVSKANYEMLAEQEKIQREAYESAVNNGTLNEVIEQQLFDAVAAANEAQDQMLSDAETWAEALKALLETELEEIADNLNKSLSGEFGSLDNLTTQMEHANSLQEEYLTTTNKIYETDKLMRTAQQEIDKSTNTVAKRKLKQFIDETNQLQQQTKLSQFELEIQQAKYDLLLAEIALEEAQDAKSMVRLQRDSEGNFGYVYTADQSQVDQAAQNLADKENALYNISLEGNNRFTETLIQLRQQAYDDLTSLQEQYLNGEIATEEEYQARRLEIENYYSEQIANFSDLRKVAITTDTRVIADSWANDFADIATDTENWKISVNGYVEEVEGAFDHYNQEIGRIESEVGLSLGEIKTKTQEVKSENDILTDSLIKKDGVIDSLEREIEEVDKVTDGYINMRDAIQEVIDKNERLVGSIGALIEEEARQSQERIENIRKEAEAKEYYDDYYEKREEERQTPSNEGTDSDEQSASETIQQQIDSITGKLDKNRVVELARNLTRHPAFEWSKYGYSKEEYYAALALRDPSLYNQVATVLPFDTGGYTGAWGPYGKLAMLHEKELVLNEGDTANFLAGMGILDRIVQTIDLQAASAQIRGILSTPGLTGMNDNIFEQNVHIEAHFEGATEASEIEAAFDNLINKASQYANRK